MIYTLELCILGIIIGAMCGIDGVMPSGLLTLLLSIFFIKNDYKTAVGTTLYVMLWPFTIGAIWNYYKEKKIDFYVGNVILVSFIIGNYISSKYSLTHNNIVKPKYIKYFTGIVGILVSIVFIIYGYYDKGN